MRRFLHTFLPAVSLVFSIQAATPDYSDMAKISVFDGAVFYDGYAMANNPDKDLHDGITRHSCSLYSIPVTDEQLDLLGETLMMHVDVQALCDNYDRIGNINLAFVPKGAESYVPEETERIEIGRFITPFMNKNKQPDTVPYDFDITFLSPVLRDSGLRERYDFRLEFEIFGIPYAANKEIPGCADRNDVFKGFLDLYTSPQPAPATAGRTLIPIVIKKPEYIGNNLNNYHEAATDTLGKTTKTYTFELPEDVSHSHIVLITSNHGANNGGEEYKRRVHDIYVDDALELTYKPGRESCEPFRKYNTQGNGIYGWQPMSDAEWQEFSNWCPGDVIDTRIIDMGDMKKGLHKIRISVPAARFANKQGDFPVSMFFIAAPFDGSGIGNVSYAPGNVNISVSGGTLLANAGCGIKAIELYDLTGACLYSRDSDEAVNVSGLAKGIYLINIDLSDGTGYTRKIRL